MSTKTWTWHTVLNGRGTYLGFIASAAVNARMDRLAAPSSLTESCRVLPASHSRRWLFGRAGGLDRGGAVSGGRAGSSEHCGDQDRATAGHRRPDELAKQVKIYRDEWGRPHIDGRDDAAVAFGFAYAQAEDYFWQVEDVYILALGRYAEAHGPRGVNSDLLNRAFEITRRSEADFGRLEPKLQRIAAAFVAGLNHYLATHADVKPRVITHFEPWYMLAMARHITLEMTFGIRVCAKRICPGRCRTSLVRSARTLGPRTIAHRLGSRDVDGEPHNRGSASATLRGTPTKR